MDGEPTENPQKIKTVEENDLDQSDAVAKELESKLPDKDQHQEDDFRDNTETELAVEVQEDTQEPPLEYQ